MAATLRSFASRLPTRAFSTTGARRAGGTSFLQSTKNLEPVELPALPYAYDALEPTISGEIMEIHHGAFPNPGRGRAICHCISLASLAFFLFFLFFVLFFSPALFLLHLSLLSLLSLLGSR
jgi:hypothetical protein